MSKTLHNNQLLISSALISGTHSSCLPVTIHESDHPQDHALIEDHEIWRVREQEYVGAYNSPSSPLTISPEDLDFLDYPLMQLPPATPLCDLDISFDLSLAESCLPSWEVPGTSPSMHQTPYVHVSPHDVHDESGHSDAREHFSGSRCAESSVLSSQHWSNGRSSTEEEPTSSPASSPSRNADQLKEKGSLKGVLRTKSISQPLKPKPQALKRKYLANILKPSASSDRPSDRIKEFIASTIKPQPKPQPNNKRVYGSKNLVSERIRRIKLNEKLLSLRALVPRISKMDKASIVADAIDYVKDLRNQLRSTQNDILAIQAGTYVGTQEHLSSDASKAIHARPHKQANNPQYKIIEVHLRNVDPKMYHLCIHCKREWGVLLHLTKALEALNLKIVSANLTSMTDRVINTTIITADKVLKAKDLKELLEKIFPMYGLHF